MNKVGLLLYFIAIAINCAYSGIVKGKVYSSEDSSPLVDVSITAITDSIHMFNTRSGNSGDFSISLPEASSECRILIQLTGYSPYSVSVNNPTQVLDLGKISLTPNAKELDAVEVTASAGRVINLPDKKIIFPNKLEKERATNPLNLLSQISFSATSLSVDEFSEIIKIGGITPQILINGVKRGMSDFNTLDPADILKIEYITHKDMRYGSPYINIVTTKKQRRAEVSWPRSLCL